MSACYANNCSGDVNVLTGEIREGSVFEQTEFDRLCSNPNVSSITLEDVNTGDRTLVYDKNDPDVEVEKVYYEREGGHYVRFERR